MAEVSVSIPNTNILFFGNKEDKDTVFTKELTSLFKEFKDKYPNNFIVPCFKKHPCFEHKSGNYNWDFISTEKNNVKFTQNLDVGIILKDLIVIDIDNFEYLKSFVELFPILNEVVSEETKKGKHFYFKRTKYCDEFGITDLARCLTINNKKVELDIKTITKTGTGGVVITTPSKDKNWFISPSSKNIEDIPLEIVMYLKEHWNGKIVTKKDKAPTLKQIKERMEQDVKDEITKIGDSFYNDDNIEELVSILNPKRATDYNDWIYLGWCLFNIFKGNSLGLKIWDDFSKEDSRYIEGDCAKRWNTQMTYHKEGYNIGSLKFWAKKDNADKYNEYIKGKKRFLSLKAISKTDLDIANLFYFLYPDEFVSLYKKDGSVEWYVFKQHRWWEGGIKDLRKTLQAELHPIFLEIAIEEREKANEMMDVDAQKRYLSISEKLFTVANDLKNTKKQKNIEEQLRIIYSKDAENFISKLNENKNLVCFENGVYDLKNKIFRNGRPDDYITFTTKYNYNDEHNNDVQYKIKKLLFEILGTIDKVEYFLNLCAYALAGHRHREKYNIFYGRGGRNGKTLLMFFLCNVFGNYYKEIKSNNLTDPKDQKGSADSEMASMKGIRLCISTEPDSKSELQLPRIKEWTGGDWIKARELFKQAMEFLPQFLLIILTNDNMKTTNNNDKANMKRMEMLKFCYEFVEDVEDNNVHRKLDNTLKATISGNMAYRQQLMLMILGRYEELTKENEFVTFKTPKVIIDDSIEYLQENNVFMEWFNEYFEKTPDKKHKIKKIDMYDYYTTDVEKYCMNKKNFYTEMDNNNFELVRKIDTYYYIGIIRKIRIDTEDENEYVTYNFSNNL